ncbi:hypothetical protein B0H11DRAFT_1208748 [Mycena galericulata]|nr:hypothetical protein B0H11DRAFT_1208748 [Mycena galericulata]
MSQLLARLEVLTLGTTRLSRQLNSVHDPMRRLPPEIASEIFILCLRDSDSERRRPQPSEAPLLLLNICSYWKAVAESTSALWTYVYLYADPLYTLAAKSDSGVEDAADGEHLPEEEKQAMFSHAARLYAEPFEEGLSRWLLRARGRASLELFCGDRSVRVIPGIVARNAHHLQSLKLKMSGESYPRAGATNPKWRKITCKFSGPRPD